MALVHFTSIKKFFLQLLLNHYIFRNLPALQIFVATKRQQMPKIIRLETMTPTNPAITNNEHKKMRNDHANIRQRGASRRYPTNDRQATGE